MLAAIMSGVSKKKKKKKKFVILCTVNAILIQEAGRNGDHYE